MDKRKINILVLLLLITNLLFSVFLAVNHYHKKNLVVFDMKGTVNLFLTQLKENKLSEEKIVSTTQKFNEALDKAIKEYTANHNVVILVSPAVVNGAEDITQRIQSTIAEKMVM